MIISQLDGGLGNQLFEFAAGYSLARRLRVPLRIDLSLLNDNRDRKYELPALAIPEQERKVLTQANPVLSSVLNWNYLIRYPALFGVTFYTHPNMSYDPRFQEVKGRYILLSGYWQSPRYFEEYANEIREFYRTNTPLDERNEECLKQIQASVSVCVHLRRGDYMNNPSTKAFHGVCEKEYYDRAISEMKEKLGGNPTLFVFSDDLKLAADMFCDVGNTVLVDAKNEQSPSDELRLMSHCDHFVIANSSFSWWAAWLGAHPEKDVIAPRQWLTDPQKNREVEDMIPNTWHKL